MFLRWIAPALEPCPNFSQRRDDASLRFLSWDMRAGDCIVHHPLAVHGAEGNFSPKRRRMAISTRYMAQGVAWDPRPATMTIPTNPQLPAGEFPTDDDLFPVAWRANQ